MFQLLLLVCHVFSLPYIDSISVEFQDQVLAAITPGKAFNLPFKIKFPEIPSRNSTHIFEITQRPDQYQMFISLDSKIASRRIYYDRILASKEYEYNSNADFILPSYTPPGNYRVKVEFKNLDRLLVFKRTIAYSQTFNVGNGGGDFDQYFKKYSDGNETQVSIYYQVWNEIDGPKRQLIAQIYKKSVITTKRVHEG